MKKFNVLHIEDRITDSELIVRELRKNKLDFHYLVVDTRDEYNNALDMFAPDIILCDHTLPSFDSLEALEILKIKQLNIPFILITGVMSDKISKQVLEAGADDFILKDRLTRLPHAVLSALEKYNFNKERKQLLYDAKETEALLKEDFARLSEKLLLATSAASIGIWEYDLQKAMFVGNNVLYSLYGITPAEFDCSYKMWMQSVHPQDKERTNREFEEAVLQQKELDTEFRIVWPDGSIHFIKSIGSFQKDAQGKPVRFLGTNQDITVARQAEEIIKESEEKYRSFFDNNSDGILLTATDGQIIAANPAACALFHMTEQELCKSERFFIEDAADPRLELLLEECHRNGKANGELMLKRKDGSTFACDVTFAAFKDVNGAGRCSIIIRDISLHKEAEQVFESAAPQLAVAFDPS